MPVPLNLIVGGARELWQSLRFPPWRSREWQLARQYERGLVDGWHLHGGSRSTLQYHRRGLK
jgi:hypothetical protein